MRQLQTYEAEVGMRCVRCGARAGAVVGFSRIVGQRTNPVPREVRRLLELCLLHGYCLDAEGSAVGYTVEAQLCAGCYRASFDGVVG